MRYTIRRADGQDDLAALIGLRQDAEQWLACRGICQWTPDYDQYARDVLSNAVAAGKAWMVEHCGTAVATVTLDGPDPDFWGWLSAPEQDDAIYLQKMTVRRTCAGRGVGDAMLNWASKRAAADGRTWIRIDVRRDNQRLHTYYLDRGFAHVRVYHAAGRRTESGWLAQRPAGSLTPTPIDLVQVDQLGG
jgi:GNAT superfamily N-acetyltransferase